MYLQCGSSRNADGLGIAGNVQHTIAMTMNYMVTSGLLVVSPATVSTLRPKGAETLWIAIP